ncbi:MAG: Hsp20/alpha crystallin family protein [Rhodothermales bacterium]
MNGVLHFAPVTRRPEIDRLFNRALGRPVFGENGNTTWSPRIDIVETNEGFGIDVDLPGLSKKDIEIVFEGDTLTLSGTRAHAHAEKKDELVRNERWSGAFSRTIRFTTDVDAAAIKATMNQGVLHLDVPRAEGSKPVRISVS